MVWFLTETSVTQQLTKMYVKQSHLLLICKGWSFIKQNNLWLLLKMAKLFYQVKEENFSAKISNWEHSRYCGKNQTILFSMLPSQHQYRKFHLFYLWDICDIIPHLFVVKVVMFLWKDKKSCHRWPIFKSFFFEVTLRLCFIKIKILLTHSMHFPLPCQKQKAQLNGQKMV